MVRDSDEYLDGCIWSRQVRHSRLGIMPCFSSGLYFGYPDDDQFYLRFLDFVPRFNLCGQRQNP